MCARSTASTSSGAFWSSIRSSASTVVPASQSARSRRSSPKTPCPRKWEPFVKINYAYPDKVEEIDPLVDAYATEHNVQNEPID